MRTTLVIDDQLLQAAEERAAAMSTTVSEVVNDALRRCLRHETTGRPPFQMITYGDQVAAQDHQPADLAAALEEDDAAGVAR